MSSLLKRWGLIIFALFILAFKANDIVELEGYFNARYSANFLKSTKNVKFVMPPGTKGRIDEIKTFHSGNYGFKVEISEGKHQGESVWVYYNPKNPGMKVYPSEEALAEEKPTTNVEEAKQVKTTEEIPALRVPSNADQAITELAASDAQKVMNKVEEVQKALKETKPCDGCEVSNMYARDVQKKTESVNYPPPPVSDFTKELAPNIPVKTVDLTKEQPKVLDTSKVVPVTPTRANDQPRNLQITRTENPVKTINGRQCPERPEGHKVCVSADGIPLGFALTNRSEQMIGKSVFGDANSREWEFHHPGNARQDLGFSIVDSVGSADSNGHQSYMMVFPRSTLPNIRTEGNRQIVTLANGETVTFDKKTKNIIGGVLKEQGRAEPLKNPAVSYQGSGVFLRIDARGTEPRLLRAGKVNISKQGKNCKVPIEDLWTNRRDKSPMHFKYFSDSDFDTYLKRKCGFGL